MKTLEKIKKLYKIQTIDGRDLNRLAKFIPLKDFKSFGLVYTGNVEHKHIEFTKENILKQLEQDVNFGFEKALNKRGISAGLMYGVVSMWNWILEEGLEDFTDYAQYGLPLFKATAKKYNFVNKIGNDTGTELKYSADE